MTHSKTRTVFEILGRDSVHPFPARMAPDLALEVLENSRDSLRILDPMAGSGTVLSIARSRGHQAVGFDIDPLAVLISKVWTTEIDPKVIRDMARVILDNARRIFVSLRLKDAYPKDSDDETKQFIRYWFDPYARRQLTSLATVIQEVQDDTIQNAFWCAFSRLIITKKSGASLAMDLSHSRPHRVFKYAPSKPFGKFLASVDRVVKNCIHSSDGRLGPATIVHEGDARALDLEDGSIDLVLTSPPYLNAIDYMRCSKFSLVWMGHSIEDIRRIRSTSVGAEIGRNVGDDDRYREILTELKLQPRLQVRQEAILMRYIDDIRRTMNEVARVLSKNGKAVFVIGENTVRGTFIPNASILEKVANRVGLDCTTRRSRKLPANRRYLPPPSSQLYPASLNKRMRREVILAFKKAA